ncbi:adenosylmethionine decarboxylase [Leptospira broomii]|uniref:adenosylmethionine decarboxylase n=1 Tax=Leptospira broomii TaxID=301541 RepID=UPI000289C49B|nr:adenosylmethionine decarboxylase [Leptospira broomii]
MNALGKHVIAEFYECDYETINNHELVEDIMLKAADLSGATTVKSVFHRFSPFGVSGVVVVSESHFAIHTWPEYGYCAIDVFTCGDIIDNQTALEYLKERFCAKSISVVEMKRGLLQLGVDLPHKPVGN